MQKIALKQEQQGKLSPQQLQFVQLLQIPAEAMAERVQAEVAENPMLEEVEETTSVLHGKEIVDYIPSRWKGQARKPSFSETLLQSKLGTVEPTWRERLVAQLSLLPLTGEERKIAEYLVGSLSSDGYLRTHLDVIQDTLAFNHYIEVEKDLLEKVLHQIQSLEPVGIAARDLREYLLLQLQRKKKEPVTTMAIAIITHCFAAFSKKNYRKIKIALKIEDEKLLKEALKYITHLSPSPVLSTKEEGPIRLQRPDFIVRKEESGKLVVDFYDHYMPALRVGKEYCEMLVRYKDKQDSESLEVQNFVKDKIQRAKWFIDAVHQRKDTLMRTMRAIVTLQKPFFEMQDKDRLRPLFMRHVAEAIGMDVSTVSRAVRHKYVATELGIFPLKYFFSEGMTTTDGKVQSSRIIKEALQTIIEKEDKRSPYTDEQLVIAMKKKGYVLARRTVAKYRGQLGLPLARMRKTL